MIIRTGTEERLTGKLRWYRMTASGFDVLQQEWEITQYYELEGLQPEIKRENGATFRSWPILDAFQKTGDKPMAMDWSSLVAAGRAEPPRPPDRQRHLDFFGLSNFFAERLRETPLDHIQDSARDASPIVGRHVGRECGDR